MKTLLLMMFLAGVAMAQVQLPELRVSMISLAVKDPARSIKFYSETLGLKLMGKPGEITLLRAGDVTIMLNAPTGRATVGKLAGAVEVIFPVDSVGAVHEKLLARGCDFVRAPHEVTTGMWAATFTDPDGHQLTILGGA